MDAAYRNAMARRDTLASEINKLQQRLEEARRELSRIDTFLHDWIDFAGTDRNSSPVDNVDNSTVSGGEGPKATKARPKNPPKEAVVDAAVAILRQHGRPMSRSDIFKALMDLGIALHGTDPEMVLSTMLWRMKDKIVRLPNFGYWPADLPYEAAHYIPPSTAQAEHAKIVAAISEADRSYYQEDRPIITDAEYDALRRRVSEIEAEFPELKRDIFG